MVGGAADRHEHQDHQNVKGQPATVVPTHGGTSSLNVEESHGANLPRVRQSTDRSR
jgi:hypothetical protein